MHHLEIIVGLCVFSNVSNVTTVSYTRCRYLRPNNFHLVKRLRHERQGNINSFSLI